MSEERAQRLVGQLPATTSIDAKEIVLMPLSVVNDVGILFTWRGRLFRAFTGEHSDSVHALFERGLIRALVRCELFPETHLTEYQLEGYELVVEHSKIEFVSYPYEWTFSMLRDAALTALRVNCVARRFGYQTKDCHTFNIVFDGVRPQWVDLGSFASLPAGVKGWRGYDQFLRAFYYPLRLWSRGWSLVARSLLANESDMLSHEEYMACSWVFARLIPRRVLARLVYVWGRYRQLAFVSERKIRQRLPGVGAVISLLKEAGLLPGQGVNLERWIRRVTRLRHPPGTRWGRYQDEYGGCRNEIVSTPRFDRIVEAVGQWGVRSVVELGGNQGIVSRLLLERGAAQQVVCTDVDEEAIDCLYTVARLRGLRLWPVRLDCMMPTRGALGSAPQERFRADAVLALALTHHLLLASQFRIEFVLDSICQYARRYVVIEFMPLGMWDGTFAPEVPSWYSVGWFRRALQERCDVLLEEQLEVNRVLFVGQLRSGGRASD